MIFPLAYLCLTSSITVLLVAVGSIGDPALAAQLAVIQGALLATFYAFSANTRNLILQGHSELTPERLLAKRLALLPVLGAVSYVLSGAAAVSPVLALLLIVRKAAEWLAEIRLCEAEVRGDRRIATRTLWTQTGATVVLAAALVARPEHALPLLVLYAASPVVTWVPLVRLHTFSFRDIALTVRRIGPYLGSTVVDGLSAYVLRLLVFVVAGPYTSGLLLTAFAIGSFAASVFANVIGPSLALRQSRTTGRALDRAASIVGVGIALLGVCLTVGELLMDFPPWLGRPGYFWLGVGLSLLGAAVMLGAQVIRLRFFDKQEGDLLFGPDVLRNIAAIVAVPVLYRIGGATGLAALYVVLASITAFFYASAFRGMTASSPRFFRVALAAMVVVPVFFTLDRGIYSSPALALAGTGGSVMAAPLPLSLLFCVIGVIVIARYREATLGFGVIFFLFVGMVFTTVLVTDGHVEYESRKLLLLFQFVVPAFGLVLGQMLVASRDDLRGIAMGFGLVLAVLIPLQLYRSIGYGAAELYHDVGLFSIYQHLEYVPGVVACAFVLILYVFWDAAAYGVLALYSALIGWYVVGAYSTLPILFVAIAVTALAVLRRRRLLAISCAVLTIASMTLHLALTDRQMWQRSGPPVATTHSMTDTSADNGATPQSWTPAIQARLYFWRLFGQGILESPRTVLLGHEKPLERKLAPSAQNYYLDFIYNFGALAFLPLAWLIAYTCRALWRRRTNLLHDLPLTGIALAVLFGLAFESFLKVPLRQPYPGIFFFFLWGALIAAFNATTTHREPDRWREMANH